MGKIKRARQKFHITSAVDDDAEIPFDTSHEVPKSAPSLPMAPKQLDVSENIFTGINIQLDKVNHFPEPESVAPSTKKSIPTKPTLKFAASATGQPEHQLTKKKKMKLKHEKLLWKIDVIQQAKRRHENKKKKNQAKPSADQGSPLIALPVLQSESAPNKKQFCDLSTIRKELVSLNDSLPSLDMIFRLKSENAKTGLEQPMTLRSKQHKNHSMVMDPISIQNTSKTTMKDTKKDAKKEYVKSYDLFRKLLKTAKTTSNAAKLPKQKNYPKRLN